MLQLLSSDYLAIRRRSEHKIARALASAPKSLEHHPGVIMTLVADVELFVDDTLELLIGTTGVNSDQFVRELFREHELSLYSSWSSRVRWLRYGFSVSVAGSHASEQLDTLIELRNSFAHGGGGVTRYQRRDNINKALQREAKLAKVLNVQASGNRLFLGEDTLARAVGICRAYIAQVDSQIRALPLRWRES